MPPQSRTITITRSHSITMKEEEQVVEMPETIIITTITIIPVALQSLLRLEVVDGRYARTSLKTTKRISNNSSNPTRPIRAVPNDGA